VRLLEGGQTLVLPLAKLKSQWLVLFWDPGYLVIGKMGEDGVNFISLLLNVDLESTVDLL
jgi:hypothetical protein